MESILKVDEVKKSFFTGQGEEVHVLHGINVDIQAGEFIMIQGQSGSGKSTLLNIMNGWEEPSSGKILINGKDVYAGNDDQRAELRWKTIALVHQTPNWVKALNVVENIAIPHMLAGNSRSKSIARAQSLLKLLDFERFELYKPVDLSGGQQQRIAFLRALVNNPQIIMADEPTGNLDSISSESIMSLFERINRELGRTIIMVTHNLELLHYAHRVVRVKDGRVAAIEVNEHHKVTKFDPKKDIIDMVRRDNLKQDKEKQ